MDLDSVGGLHAERHPMVPASVAQHEFGDFTPPDYAGQGKTRGRKPAAGAPKAKAAAKGKAKAQAKARGKAKAKAASKSKPKAPSAVAAEKVGDVRVQKRRRKGRKGLKGRKARKLEATASGCSGRDAPAPGSGAPRAKAKAKAKAKAQAKAASAKRRAGPRTGMDEAGEFQVPEDAVPAPEGLPSNLAYSNAYLKAKIAQKDLDACKLAGQHASWLLRVHGQVSASLCGRTEYNPRKRKAVAEPAA